MRTSRAGYRLGAELLQRYACTPRTVLALHPASALDRRFSTLPCNNKVTSFGRTDIVISYNAVGPTGRCPLFPHPLTGS